MNRDELLSHGDVKAKEIALALMEEAIKSTDPYEAVKRALKVENNKLIVRGKEFLIREKSMFWPLERRRALWQKLSKTF